MIGMTGALGRVRISCFPIPIKARRRNLRCIHGAIKRAHEPREAFFSFVTILRKDKEVETISPPK